MKKNFKNKLVGCMVLTTLVGILAVPSLAQVGQKMAYLNYNNMKVTLNGQTLNLKDSNGNAVEPFTIDGTTYLPLASISQALGVNVSWDGSTNTVALTTTTPSTSGNTASPTINTTTTTTQSISMDKAKEIALNHAGLTASQATFFKSILDWENGRQVYDIEFYSGNKEYDYEIDVATGTILSYDYDIEGYINTPVTPSTPGTPTQSTGDIGATKAKEIALNHAGVASSNAVFLNAKLDYDDGRRVYDVEFYSGNKEYDYEIDAASGTIISFDYDIEGYVNTPAQSTNDIGANKAKEIALNHAGVAASNAVFLNAKLDYDDGRRVYDVEFYSGNKEYDYEIDAASGTIISFDYDVESYTPSQSAGTSSGSYISEAAAKQIVEQKAGTTGIYREFKLDRDDGRTVYEGELRSGITEYDFTIDATSGTILEWEIDRG